MKKGKNYEGCATTRTPVSLTQTEYALNVADLLMETKNRIDYIFISEINQLIKIRHYC